MSSIVNLDLRDERCPMSLLKAKRERSRLSERVPLCIWVTDQVSLSDMTRYFSSKQFQTQVVEKDKYFLLTVSK